MAKLSDKFTIEQIKDLEKRLNKIHYNVTHWQTRSTATETELQLINTIDHLVRVPNILCHIIEQALEGHIETFDPHGYADGKLGIAESSLIKYLKLKDINLD
jgi:hypothetical protein